MDIEQAIDILKNSIADYVIGEYCEKCADNKICDDRNEDCYFQQAIDIVVTAYEKEKNKDMSCDLTETRADNIDESTMLKQIKLKLQEKNITIETLLAEFERLEDLEDDLTTVYLNGVYDGEKKVEDKIKPIQIIDLDGKIHNVYKIEEE